MWPSKRFRLSLAFVFAILALVTLVVMLIDGSRWYGWALVVSGAGAAVTQLYAIRKSEKAELTS